MILEEPQEISAADNLGFLICVHKMVKARMDAFFFEIF